MKGRGGAQMSDGIPNTTAGALSLRAMDFRWRSAWQLSGASSGYRRPAATYFRPPW